MSLTPREAEVMDLWDAGCTVEEIAIATGKSQAGVAALTSTYSFEGRDITHEAAVRKGSADLAAALTDFFAQNANCSEAG
ncbi:hypothetical protein J3454_14215 [Erythrobacter sp. NFXS35]|uniref:hypothetical protein n=1 Tax=Erythrobacter sp. NFXS35 TaxID=2818436 RepID=UPI0032DF7CB7